MLSHFVLMITLYGGQGRYHYTHFTIRKQSAEKPGRLLKETHDMC